MLTSLGYTLLACIILVGAYKFLKRWDEQNQPPPNPNFHPDAPDAIPPEVKIFVENELERIAAQAAHQAKSKH